MRLLLDAPRRRGAGHASRLTAAAGKTIVRAIAQWLIQAGLVLALTASAAPDAFAWGAVHGAYGGAAYRGPMGGGKG